MLEWLTRLFGPIFAKEMVEVARRKRYFFNRAVYGTALLFGLFIIWENYYWKFQYNSRSLLQTLAEMAADMFSAVVWVQYGAVYLFVPTFLCGAVASEREAHTLDLLLTTQLSDSEIVLGKLSSRLAVLLLLVASALPVMSLVMLFGGIDPGALWRSQTATLLAMLYAGAHAIYFSSISRSPMGALVRTYWWMALWLLGLPALMALLVEALSIGPNSPGAIIVWGLVFINPIGPFLAGAIPEAQRDLSRYLGGWFFSASFVIPTCWSALLIVRAIQRLRLPPLLLARLANMIGVVRNVRNAWQRRKRLRERRRTAQAARIGILFDYEVRNPLWLRARLARVYDREGHIQRIQWGGWVVAGFFLLMFLLFEPHALDDEECAMVFLTPTWIGVAGLGAIVASAGLVGDRNRGFLDLVLATPLAPREIIDGTLLAVWRHIRVVYWLAWALGGLFVLTGSVEFEEALCSLITGTLFTAVVVMMGVQCSLPAKTVPNALAPTFALGVLVCAMLPIVAEMFEDGARPLVWVASALWLAITWPWVMRRPSAAAVGAHFIAVHLVLVGLATCWTLHDVPYENQIGALNPGYLVLGSLDGLDRLFRSDEPWSTVLVPYWVALVANLVWGRWWMMRHFDWLAERTLSAPDAVAHAQDLPSLAG